MARRVLLAVLSLVCAGWLAPLGEALAEKKDAGPVARELKKLEGVWVLTAMESQGDKATQEVLDRIAGRTLTIRGTRGVMSFGQREFEVVAIKIDPTKTPKHIDITTKEMRGQLRTREGVYEVVGDTLKICFKGSSKTAGRPKELKTAAGDKLGERVLRTYERKKKAKP